MKATTLLRRQHREAERLFDEVMYGEAGRNEAVHALALELAAHAALEEQFLYPLLRESLPGAFFMSIEEHAMMKVALERLVQAPPGDEAFEAKVALLKRVVLEHVEEEENDIFPELEEGMSRDDLEALGQQLEEANARLRQGGFEPLLAENRRSAVAAARGDDLPAGASPAADAAG
ncbi:MAG TPA: hemerythrin domain-containing protein [Polyangiaceae bacterium]|nr:hemerythrin domain-containing protein [Polyangiaceae bacterium]